MYSKLTIENKSAVKRFSHSKRFQIAQDILDLKDGQAMLDYGTGDGHFILSLAARYPLASIVGFEPVDTMYNQLVLTMQKNNALNVLTVLKTLDDLPNHSFDKISCFEVMEHLDNEMQRVAFENIKRLLKKNGSLFVSVPIEVGFSSIIKNILRLILRQPHMRTNFLNIARSFLGLHIEREKKPYVNSHVGFYYFNLERTFSEEGFIIRQKIYSPFKFLRGFLNSQIFYVLSQP